MSVIEIGEVSRKNVSCKQTKADPAGSAPRTSTVPGLRRFSSSNLVESGLFQVKGLNLGRALDLVANHLIDRGKAFPVVPFGIFLCFPEAQSQQALGILLGDQNNLVNESGLTLQEREDSIVDGTGKLPRLSGFAGDCYYSGKHKRYSFQVMRKVVPSPLGAIDLSNLRLSEEKINRSWKEKRLRQKGLRAAAHLSPPPAHANQKKTPVMEEFRFFAFEGMADELQDPAHYEKASRVHPEAVNEYRGHAQSQRHHDHGNTEAVAGPVYRMSMTARVLRNPLLVGASTQHGCELYIRLRRTGAGCTGVHGQQWLRPGKVQGIAAL